VAEEAGAIGSVSWYNFELPLPTEAVILIWRSLYQTGAAS